MQNSFLYFKGYLKLACLVLVMLLLLPAQGFAQTWNQGTSLNAGGVYGTSESRAVAVDADGNQYITGRFNGVVQFGSSTLYSTALAFYSRSTDAFVARLNANGTWAWARALGNEAVGNGIAVTGTGSSARVYLVGTSQTGTLRDENNTPLTGTSLTLTTVGSTDAFVASLDGDGTWLWARTLAGDRGEGANAIAVGGTGSNAQLYLTGHATGGISLYNASHVALTGPGQSTIATGGVGADAFVASLNNSGDWNWVRVLGGGASAQGRAIAVAGGGNTAQVFLTGEYGSNSASSSSLYLYDATTTPLTGAGQRAQSAGYSDVFVASIGATGTWDWVRGAGGAGSIGETGYGIAVTDAGSGTQVYVTGSCTGNTRLRDATNTALTSPGLLLPGSAVAFVARLDATGNWVWARAMGGSANTKATAIAAADTGGLGQLYVSGFFFGQPNSFYDASGNALPGVGQSLTASTGVDTFVANLDADGNWNWARAVGSRSSGGNDSGIAAMVAGSTTQVYVVGTAESTATLRDGAGTPVLYLPLSRRTAFAVQLTGGSAWQMARSSSNGGTSRCTATVRDAEGNQYVTGTFTGSVTFGSATIYCAGGFYNLGETENAFVAKRNANGTWAWARALGGAIYGGASKSIAVAGAGSTAQIYLTGSYSGYGEPATLRDANDIPLTGPGLSLAGSGSPDNDAFVARIDANGNWVWARSIVGSGSAEGSNAVAVTGAGSNAAIYITGVVGGPYPVTLRDANNAPITGPGLNIPSSGGAFVAKLDASGAWQWARSMEGGGRVQSNGLATTAGQVFITGNFVNTARLLDASNTPLTGVGQVLAPAGGGGAFVASLDANGTWGWARAIAGSSRANAIAVAGTGNAAQVYITGDYTRTATLRDATDNALAAPGQVLSVPNIYASAFVAKLDAAGNWNWARSFGSDLYNYQVFGYGIAAAGVGSNTQVYITGSFGVSARPYNASNVAIQRANHHVTAAAGFGSEDGFVANLDIDGTWQWARALGGGINPDVGTSIAVSGTGRQAIIDIAGYFSHEATLRDSTNQATPNTDLVGSRINGVNTGFVASLAFLQSTPLPVELMRFSVSRRGEDGLVEWRTASEKNNAYFVVESSLDGYLFRPVGKVAGAGTNTQSHDYQLVDINIGRYARSVVYYRLRQTDEGGATAYSPIQTLSLAPAGRLSAQAYPNPSRQLLTLSFQCDQAGPVLITITDMTGRQLYQQQADAVSGANTLMLRNAAHLPSGLYSLRLQHGDIQEVIRLVRD
jgi:hypothetical protein